MTISKKNKLFVLSMLICAIQASSSNSGPIASKLFGFAKSYFGRTTAASHCFTFQGNNAFKSIYTNDFNRNMTETEHSVSSDSDASGWFSTKTLLAGAAVVAGGYAIYKCYTAYKKREAERKEREEREEAERRAELKRQQENRKEKNIKEALKKRLVVEQKVDLISRRRVKKKQQGKQREKRLALRNLKLKLAHIDSVFRNMEAAAQAESEGGDFSLTDAEIVLSGLVRNCSLCNQLTVNYLNELYKDEGKEDKEHVIGFLRGVKALGADQSGWNNRDIMPLVNNGGTSFVMDRLEYIAKGEQLVGQITSGQIDCNSPQSQKEYLDSIISITWYFYAKALQKGDGFSKSASFNIESKSLMNFFMGYYHQVRKWHKNFFDMGRAWAAQYAKVGTNKLGDHPFAYERCSSHLKELNKTNYGIDIRFVIKEKSGDVSPRIASLQALLPDGKAHLLLIPYDVDNGRFLLKPESHATSVFDVPDAVEHGLEFLHGSKDNDYDYTRREKIKKDVMFKKLMKRYKKVVPGQGKSTDAQTGLTCRSSVDDSLEINVWGVQHMLQRLDHWLGGTSLGETTRQKVQQLKSDLKKFYTDHHDIRFAHEVVFKEVDFR